MKLKRGERQYWHKPFWGLGSATPDVQVGEGGSWVTMSVASGFTPPSDWSAPSGADGSPSWFRVLLAGPDAADNPVGTVVVTTTSRIRTRVTAGDEIDIKPDSDEWIHLVS